MNVSRKIEFPEEILLTLRKSEDEFISEIKKTAAVKYYKEKKLSLGQCAVLAELCEEDFIKYLSYHKVSIFNYDSPDELFEDIRNA